MKGVFTGLILTIIYVGQMNLSAQSIARSVIGSSGKDVTNGQYQLSYTLGDIVVSSVQAEDIQLTQGFQQPDGNFRVSIHTDLEQIVEESAFPNPTQGTLSLSLISKKHVNLALFVHDVQGRTIYTHANQIDLLKNIEREIPIDISDQAEGIYLIELREVNGNAAKVFRVQKID